MRIQHNIMAMSAYRNYNTNTSAVAKNLEKLSSGYKINRAGDDAAGLAISEKMRAQITGLNAAQKNVKDGVSLVKTAEGAMQEIQDMLNRMDYLATQSANGTYDNEVDRANLQKEVDALKTEINRIADSANFNGIKLLDGSLDETIKTSMNDSAKGFGIADWVGTTANNDAVVGDGTIVHTGGKEAVGTEFAIEFNNSTVAGKDGVSITLGDNEKISLDGKEIAQGASAEEIAAAFEKKLGGEYELLSTEGEKVKFNVKADGDRLVFTQAEAPTSSKQIVNGNMAVKYEGIGSGAADTTERLNTTKPTVTLSKPAADAAKTATQTLTWGGSVTDEQKDALNKALGDGVKLATTVTYGAGPVITGATLDISKLTKALGEDYEVVVTGAGGALTPTDAGVVTDTGNAPTFSIAIKDKASADTIATIGLGAVTEGSATPAGVAGKTYSADIVLAAANNTNMNTAPAITQTDDGKLTKTGSTSLLALDGGLTEDDLNALNAALAGGDQTITLNYTGLVNNEAATTSVLHAELSQGLADAGYYLATSTTTPSLNKYDPDTGLTSLGKGGGDDKLYLYDKNDKLIGTITTNSNAGTDITAANSVITLSQSSFNKEDTVTDGANATKVKIGFEAAAAPDGQNPSSANSVDWAATGLGSAPTLRDGDKFTFTIADQDFTIEVKTGLTADEAASGKYLDVSALADTKATTMLAAMQTALNTQAAKAAQEASKGNKDYVAIDTITLTGTTGEAGRVDITGNTTNYVYVADAADDPADQPGATTPGGKDPNASTVNIKQGATASDGRLASTYLEASDFEGLKDGSQLRVGDKTYTFAVGKDSKVKPGEDVVDLTDMEASDADLLNKALVRLTQTADPNAMFSVGNDEPGRVTFTENKDYTWGEGVDLSTHKGIAEQFGFYVDGASTTTSGKALTLQIGDTSEEHNQMKVSVGDMHTSAMGSKDGTSIADIDISTQDGAAAAVSVIKDAINYVSSVRGTLGATQNRLEHTANNLSVMAENIQDAESTIRDTDIAEEMMSYTKNNILVQSAQAMLAQANQVPQGVLQLLG